MDEKCETISYEAYISSTFGMLNITCLPRWQEVVAQREGLTVATLRLWVLVMLPQYIANLYVTFETVFG